MSVATEADDQPTTFSETGLPRPAIERVAERFRLLGDPTRLQIINELYVHGELSVGQIVENVGTSYGAVSKHLALLRSFGLIARRREGTFLHYRISDPSLAELCDVTCRSLDATWARPADADVAGPSDD